MTDPVRRDAALRRWLGAPVDARSLAAFRILFGALMAASVVRFWAYGWIDQLLVEPSFHFTYLGFGWVRPWPAPWMHVHFAVMALAALGLAAGVRTRASAAVFFLTFTWAELIEKAAYLNHYVLVSLLALLLMVVPSGAIWSVDALRRDPAEDTVPRWALLLPRVQVALVYGFAGLAKLQGDWLLRGEPLRTWLQAFTHLPLVGPSMGEPATALAMSWGGALFDLAVVPLLLWPPTRRWACAVAVAFHVAIWLLFPVGIFSWLMLVSLTLFLPPSWPGRWGLRLPARAAGARRTGAAPMARAGLVLASCWLALQVTVPLRCLAYPGDVRWTEEGFRFAWRVMLIEKTGQVEYRVRTPDGHEERVYPRRRLTPLQFRMLSTQPDMIHEYALHLAEEFGEGAGGPVEVRAEAWVSLNGRPARRIVDPEVDLASRPRSLRPAGFILPLESSPRHLDAGSGGELAGAAGDALDPLRGSRGR